MDQSSGDLATLLVDELAAWFRAIGALGVILRVFTGVTKDEQAGLRHSDRAAA
jgi:hypothetical protein